MNYCIRNEWRKCHKKTTTLSRKKVNTLAWGGFWLIQIWLMWKMGDGNILQIHFSMCIKSHVTVQWDDITYNMIILKCLSKVLSKYFCIIACQNGLTQLHIYCVSSWCASNLKEKYYFQWFLLLFLVIFSASLLGSDNFVLFISLDGNGAHSQMFYAIFQFLLHKLNSQLWMETQLLFPSKCKS